MKRLFAMFLILAMLIPMGLVAQAEEVEKKPFLMVNWGDVPENGYTNVYHTPYFWSNPNDLKKGVANSYCPELGASNIPDLAEATKELFDTYPEGARHINFNMVATAVHALADVCFQEDVPPLVSGYVEEFMKEYKRIGGKLDGMIIDVEYLPIASYYIRTEFHSKDPLVYDKIVKNPAYQEKIRPELVKRGFKFYSPVTENTPEIYGIHSNAGAEYANCQAIWDVVLRNYQADIINACCAPMWKYYPDAELTDYTARDTKPWVSPNNGGIRKTPGTASNENFYSYRPSPSYFKNNEGPIYNAIKTRVDAVYENNAFNRFIYEANTAKSIYLSADKGVSWWFAHAYYEENENPYVYSPYYSELVFHTSLLDPVAIYGYILEQDCITDGERDPDKYANALKIVDDCLRQASDLVGYADRKPIAVENSWNHDFVLSGMYANGRNVWRITPDENAISRSDFLVADAKDPTFRVNGETVTFPGGKIIEDGEVYGVGTLGYWIETPANVTPVITRVDNYYRANASYQETFEGFEVGTEYNYNNALPTATWENKKQGSGSAIVIADPTNANNKVLEVKGNYFFRNVKLPQNVQSGDGYAKHQAWEVTVTLPADLAADDELVLLNIIPEKKTAKDKGFQVIGTKVYYDQNGAYVEMTGVTLAAGGKYTFVRDMDFTVQDAFTCDYYVYDGTGTLIGKAKDVPIADKSIPVYSLGMNVKNPSGAAILLDDYKLYPTKVTADFASYNAETGIAATGKETGNVAYRLSYLNATNTEKTFTVMAAYYDGETKISEEVVQEIKLSANYDGVITGVVENKQSGKAMQLYLKDNNPPEAEQEVATPGADTAPVPETTPAPSGEPEAPANNSKLVIIIAAAAAVVLVAVVIVVIVSKKKKAPKTEETPEEKTEE